MCTVTFIPDFNSSEEDSFLLTFSRDEAVARKTFPPSFKNECGVAMVFPQDGVAGGTWLGVSEQKRLVGVMNGGFVAHKRNPPYRKSRGVVVKEFLATENNVRLAENYHFEGIEPFTMLIIEFEKALTARQLVWDGTRLHQKKIIQNPQIWSSSPLYNRDMQQKREDWFQDLLGKKDSSAEALWNFHHTAGEGDLQTNLIVDRGFLKTQSISQIEITQKKQVFKYKSLADAEFTQVDLANLVQKEH